MNATGKQYSGPTDRLYGAWSVASHVLDWTRVEQAIAHAALTKLSGAGSPCQERSANESSYNRR